MTLADYVKDTAAAWATITATFFVVAYMYKLGMYRFYGIPKSYILSGVTFLFEKIFKVFLGLFLIYNTLWLIDSYIKKQQKIHSPLDIWPYDIYILVCIAAILFLILRLVVCCYLVANNNNYMLLKFFVFLMILSMVFLTIIYTTIIVKLYFFTLILIGLYGALVSFASGYYEACTKITYEVTLENLLILDHFNGKFIVSKLSGKEKIEDVLTVIDTRTNSISFKKVKFNNPIKINRNHLNSSDDSLSN